MVQKEQKIEEKQVISAETVDFSKPIDKILEGKATETVTFSTFGIAKTNSATIEFSTMPPMDFTRRLQYLIQYPHGCLEQTTSSVYPQLYLNDISLWETYFFNFELPKGNSDHCLCRINSMV